MSDLDEKTTGTVVREVPEALHRASRPNGVNWTKTVGQARKFSDGEFVILVDRRDNTSFAEVRRTLQNESCHVFVDWKESEMHGAMFL